jgi:hypothetical protein
MQDTTRSGSQQGGGGHGVSLAPPPLRPHVHGMGFPTARTVRDGSPGAVPRLQPRRWLRRRLTALQPHLRSAGAHAVGLLPLWAAAALAIALLWSAGLAGAP